MRVTHLTVRAKHAIIKRYQNPLSPWLDYPKPWGGMVHDCLESSSDVDLTCWVNCNDQSEAARIKDLCPLCRVVFDAALEGIDLDLNKLSPGNTAHNTEGSK